MGGSRSISERLSALPPGRHLLPSDFVTSHQRARLLFAVSELVAERGYQKTTIELIAKSARVALSTFYEQFASKEECFLAAFDGDVQAAQEVFEQVLERDLPWTEQVAQAMEVLIELVLAEPSRSKLVLVASQSAGPAAFKRYQAMLDWSAPMLREGRSLSPTAAKLPDGLEVALAGGLAWLMHQRLINDELDELRELLPEMIQLTLTPYVGEGEARRVAQASPRRKGVVLPKGRREKRGDGAGEM